jgi:hypothetical protein
VVPQVASVVPQVASVVPQVASVVPQVASVVPQVASVVPLSPVGQLVVEALVDETVGDLVDVAADLVRPDYTPRDLRVAFRRWKLNPTLDAVNYLMTDKGATSPQAYAHVWALEPYWAERVLAAGADLGSRAGVVRAGEHLRSLALADLAEPLAVSREVVLPEVKFFVDNGGLVVHKGFATALKESGVAYQIPTANLAALVKYEVARILADDLCAVLSQACTMHGVNHPDKLPDSVELLGRYSYRYGQAYVKFFTK